MLSHAIMDMKEISRADMDIVAHMLSHTDWERHDKVMGDIFKASEAECLGKKNVFCIMPYQLAGINSAKKRRASPDEY